MKRKQDITSKQMCRLLWRVLARFATFGEAVAWVQALDCNHTDGARLVLVQMHSGFAVGLTYDMGECDELSRL